MSELLRELSRARLLLALAGVTAVSAVAGLVLLVAGLPGWGVFVTLLGVQLAVLGSALILHRALMRGGQHQGSAAEIAALQGSSDAARLSQAIHALRQEFSVRDASTHQLQALLRQQEASRLHLRRELFDEYFGAGSEPSGSWSIVSPAERRSTR